MRCIKPLRGIRRDDGKITFLRNVDHNLAIPIPCGQCYACRLERSRVWATRCMHEAQMHENNVYLTLTYDDKHLPKDYSINRRDLQLFWKRLRKCGHKFSYYACGEYGDRTGRPHYHAILFGYKVPDAKFYRRHRGNNLYNSDYLEKIWNKGNIIIGSVTFDSCAYVARYIMKKVTGKNSEKSYEIVDEEIGEVIGNRTPEFTTMSKNPAIGKRWYEKYKTDVYQEGTDGKVIINGTTTTSPRYYDQLFENECSSNTKILEKIKNKRKEAAEINKEETTPARLKVLSKIVERRVKLKLPRNLT